MSAPAPRKVVRRKPAARTTDAYRNPVAYEQTETNPRRIFGTVHDQGRKAMVGSGCVTPNLVPTATKEVGQWLKFLQFPQIRRIGSIRKMARMMARLSPEGAERALETPLRQQYEALIRRGMPPEMAASEMEAFELAVRTHLWQLGGHRGGGDATA